MIETKITILPSGVDILKGNKFIHLDKEILDVMPSILKDYKRVFKSFEKSRRVS